jgi:hypothetical protein
MAISMFDQMLFLEGRHEVVLGRLTNTETWVCEKCGKPTDLTKPPFKGNLLPHLTAFLAVCRVGRLQQLIAIL